MQNNQCTAIIKKDGDSYIGWIEEISGVNCQENNIKNLQETLKVTLGEALEFNPKDAIELAGSIYQEEKIAVPV